MSDNKSVDNLLLRLKVALGGLTDQQKVVYNKQFHKTY